MAVFDPHVILRFRSPLISRLYAFELIDYMKKWFLYSYAKFS